MRRTTLGDLGARLPIGAVQPDGTLCQAFGLRPYKVQTDRHLAIWTDKQRGRYDGGQLVAARATKLLALLLDQVGGQQYGLLADGDSQPEAELALHRLAYADVLYLLLWARVESMGPDLAVRFRCPACDQPASASFDLRQIQVSVLDGPAERQRWVPLRDGLPLRDGRRAARVQVSPLLWSVLLQPGVLAGGSAALDAESLAGAITAVAVARDGPGEEIRLSQQEVCALSHRDALAIQLEAGHVLGGPDVTIYATCPREGCAGSVREALNWSPEHFFGLSSLPDLAGMDSPT